MIKMKEELQQTLEGVKKGDIVTIAIPNTPENVICLYALNKIGAIVQRTKDISIIPIISF